MYKLTKFLSHYYATLLTLILTLLVCYSFLMVDWYPMHDSTHPIRLMLLRETVGQGQFPAIWADHINMGFGYPLFHLYAPLFHYLALGFSYFFSLAISLKITLCCTIGIGVCGMWFCTRHLGRLSATLACMSFAFSPYLALDLYVRGAYSELLALALFPWVIYTLKDLRSLNNVISGSLSTVLLLLAHNLVPILIFPLLLIWIVLHTPPVKNLILYVMLTLGLSAWFVGPLLFERGFTQAEHIAKTTEYQKHFVEPWQIWNSTWGFGGSAIGVEDGMSFKMGKLQLIFGALGALTALNKKNRDYLILGLFTLGYLFLTTAASSTLWQNLSVLQLVQFPWRSLGPALVLLSILVAYGYSKIQPKFISRGVFLILILGLVSLNLKYFRVQSAITFPSQIVDIAPVVPEYLPVWMPSPPLQPSQNGERAYYPTWQVMQHGERLLTSPDSRGILHVNLIDDSPITYTQSHTPLEKYCYLVTIFAVVGLIFLRIRIRK